MAQQNFDVKENIAVIRTNDKGDTLEINKVSWYGREPKVDIRYWSNPERKPSKGLTLTDQEFEEFKEFFKNM